MSEIVEIVDRQGKLTGQVLTRKQTHQDGSLHAVAGLILTDGNGRWLLQLRKIVNGVRLYDAAVGGHVEPGENPRQTALREAKEELGIEVTDTDLGAGTDGAYAEDIYPDLGVYANHLIYFWVVTLRLGMRPTAKEQGVDLVYMTEVELKELVLNHPEKCTIGLIEALKKLRIV